VQFTETATVFNPPCPDIQQMIATVLDALIGTVNAVNRVVYTRPFTDHVVGIVKDAPNVQQIIRNDRFFQEVCDQINAKIKEDFAGAEHYVEQHITAQFRSIYDDTRNWDFEAFQRQSDLKIKKLKDEMDKVQGYEEKLEKTMKNRQQCGILEVESRNLKQIMTPMVKHKMSSMKDLVRELAKALCKKQLGELRKRIQQIAARPHSLKDFAGYVDSATQLKSKERGLNKAISTVEQMYSLLKQHQVVVPPED
jgi:HPt (histidine-containing phosphotransfer) domain-containing protein